MQLLPGDCLELMKDIPDGTIDMILCDLFKRKDGEPIEKKDAKLFTAAKDK